jgi:hypothetical protein
MDGNRFDALTRSLATPRSRRAVVRTLAGSAAGGLIALAGRRPAGADLCKGTGKECKKNIQCCSGSCAPPTASISTHGSGSVCCPAGQVQYPVGACCTPTTCAAQGKNCGQISDGCGGTLTCGSCTAPQTCGGGGVTNVCDCTPTTCAAAGAECGAIADGCGDTLTCPDTCLAPETCGGGLDPHPNRCGCTPAACQPGQCGAVPDGCGTQLSCGGCDTGQCLSCDETSHACVSRCTAPRLCSGGNCKLPDGETGCVDDEDCVSGLCAAGTCQTGPGGEGASCDSDTDCADGRTCVDSGFGFGVCCASAKACGTICCGSGEICDPAGDCCAPLMTSCPAGSCDFMSDDCGTLFDCGPCGGGEECVDNVCQPVVCRPAEATCDASLDQCCGDLEGRNSSCCHPVGAECFDVFGGGDSCCDGARCVAGGPLSGSTCVGCTGDFNKAFGGAPCISNDACCSGYCHTPSGNCCRREGADCSAIGPFSFECCPYLGLTCSGTDGTCIPCRPKGATCDGVGVESTCCLGLSCDGGTCVQGTCGGFAQPCQEDSACCLGTRCNTDQRLCNIHVCNVDGQPCENDSHCCDGFSCDIDPILQLGVCRSV